jgi:hypothetical protein
LFLKPRQPDVYAVLTVTHNNNGQYLRWVKAVAYKKPDCGNYSWNMIREVVGPFRSEVDCEEFIKSIHIHWPEQSTTEL